MVVGETHHFRKPPLTNTSFCAQGSLFGMYISSIVYSTYALGRSRAFLRTPGNQKKIELLCSLMLLFVRTAAGSHLCFLGGSKYVTAVFSQN